MTPLVSIIMPAYNAGDFIKQAIESILGQTFENWELILVNDGSTDETASIIRSFQDKRIRFTEHAKNEGIVTTLNEGIALAGGKYIARMDADDLCEPTRIEKAIQCFEADPQLIVAGSYALEIDENALPTGRIHMPPATDMEIKAALFFTCPFLHPSIMIRKKVLEDTGIRYNPSIRFAQDYVLYSELWQLGRFKNLGEPLIRYRVHTGGQRVTDDRNSAEIIRGRMLAWNNILKVLGLSVPAGLLLLHDKLCYYAHRISGEEAVHLGAYLAFLKELKARNRQLSCFSTVHFENNISIFASRALIHPNMKGTSFAVEWLRGMQLTGILPWVKIPFRRIRGILRGMVK